MSRRDQVAYFRRRIDAENIMAVSASSLEARQAHAELALRYHHLLVRSTR